MIQRIGRYEVKAKLGQGGMAAVYRAHDPRFKRDVAIKVLPPAFLDNAMFRARFEREAQVIASLEYSGIVPVYDFGEQEGQLYLVMRYMPGGSLADRISLVPPKLSEIVHIFNHLAPALDHVHEHGIIHRDLKPGNILFDQYDTAWISDFGIARLNEGSATLTGDAVIGTPAYMSPEQAQGMHELDGRSDIYAMGAILFEMLTGKQPYEATTPMGVILKHITEPVPRLNSVKADLPAGLEIIISRSMEKDRELRYPSMAAMAADLSGVLDGQVPVPAVPLTQNPPPLAPPAESSDQVQATVLEEMEPEAGISVEPGIPEPAAQIAFHPENVAPLPQPAASQPVQSQPTGYPQAAKPVRKTKRSWSPLFIFAGLVLFGIVCLGAAVGGWWLYSSAANSGKTDPTSQDSTGISPEVTPTETALLNSTQASTNLFFDDFSDPSSGWQTYEGDNGKMMYQSGSFQILVDIPNWLMISRPGRYAGTVSIKTEAYKSSGPDENIFGAVCRYVDEYNFYFLVISSDGYYGIVKLVNGETKIIGASAMSYSSYINQGRTSNSIQAVCAQNNLSLYANGTLLTTVQDDDFDYGEVGLLVGSYTQYGVNILFDNFSMIDQDNP